MTNLEAIKHRHAVRHFDGKPITKQHQKMLNQLINKINKKAHLHLQLVINEPLAFSGKKAAICNFTGCVNYLAIVGPDNDDLKEKAGYYGEQVVLEAIKLGIKSCWVAKTFDKIPGVYKVNKSEALALVVAFGYAGYEGKQHKSKSFERVVSNKTNKPIPTWFRKGVELALLAPTGINQQGFKFALLPNNCVRVKNLSFCKNVDLGIVKYHFELGAGNTKFKWIK